MLKYVIVAGIFGCVSLYSLSGVLELGFSALTESESAERRFAFSLFVWWSGVLVVSTIILASAICRIVSLRRQAKVSSRESES